jgi:hypothetical protein
MEADSMIMLKAQQYINQGVTKVRTALPLPGFAGIARGGKGLGHWHGRAAKASICTGDVIAVAVGEVASRSDWVSVCLPLARIIAGHLHPQCCCCPPCRSC